MKSAHFFALCLSAALTGCASLKPSDFATSAPIFDPVKFFTGHTKSSGVLENRAGAPTQRVTTATSGHVRAGTLHLEQDLTFSDGKKQHRTWEIRKVDTHSFVATANDVIGTIRGEAYGNAFHWQFPLALRPGNPLANVEMSQWMYLQPDGRTMINHTTIKKAGIVVGQVSEQFRREP